MYQLRNTELRTAQPCLPTNQSATQRLSARFLINNVHKQMNNKFKTKCEFTYLKKQTKFIWDNQGSLIYKVCFYPLCMHLFYYHPWRSD